MTASKPPAHDMLRRDYLAAAGIPWALETIPDVERGVPCTHQPPHIIRVPDPRPEAAAGAKVRVLLDCPTRPLYEALASTR